MKLLLSVVAIFAFSAVACAHPVAQGSIELTITNTAIAMRVRVSPEQVFVANGHAAQSTEQAYADHADYLLRHLHLFADDRALSGTLVRHAPPHAGEPFAIYEFGFPLTSRPANLRLEQDVLNEIDYAPGNRWEATYVVAAHDEHGATLATALSTSRAPAVLSLRTSANSGHIVFDYLRHGIEHILTGYDHLLFIAALALAVTSFWELCKIIAAFTLAHTITLTLSVLNIARVPSQIVEPMIAASIVFVALQNVLWPQRSHGAARLGVAFFFGLFHGLGFAGGLLDAMSGLPGVSVGVAIVAFSIGVELGHQCVVLPLFALTKIAANGRTGVHENILRGGSALISAAGMFYLLAAVSQASGLHWSR